ncbi:MAG: WecB/TagA/CpsF family glycosyltransferase [Ignavibacteriales bacterium]|nr:WecB/TagA/CpsF family glycosyltransferase [Ignavibacteriales bacterium]
MKPIDKLLVLNRIRVDDADFNLICDRIKSALENRSRLVILYANIQLINLAKKNINISQILNSAEIVFPDGIGIWLASRLFGRKKNTKFNWTDYAWSFLSIVEQNNWKIFFLGSTDEILARGKANIYKKYPNINLVGSLNGFNDLENSELLQSINNVNPDILWVGLGSLKQEYWISENKDKLNVRIIQAVGDLFALFTNQKIRGPKLFQKLGLEWVFRLINEPKRLWRRYLLGIPKFFMLVIRELIKKRSEKNNS